MIPPEITYLLDNYDSEDFNLLFTKADYSGENPRLNLLLREPGASPQNWSLEVIGHRASEISFTPDFTESAILLTDDHPLLWQYADMQSDLYFNGASTDVYKVVAALNKIDFDLFGKYQRSSAQVYTLLKASSGLLARGSKKLLSKYEECLNRHSISTSVVDGYVPTYWDGVNKSSGNTLKIFLVRGSYVIGRDFIFSKCD